MLGDQRVVRPGHRHLRQRPERPGRRLDLQVGRRHDLGAVAEVQLVPVVGRRVVAGRDHDARRPRAGAGPRTPAAAWAGAAAAGAPGCRRRPARAAASQGELLGPVPRVAADHHAGLRRLRVDVEQPAGQRRGGAADDRAVHPVRSGGDRSAQAGRAEFQPPGEPVGQLGAGRGRGAVGLGAVGGPQQRGQLGAVAVVRVVGDPCGDLACSSWLIMPAASFHRARRICRAGANVSHARRVRRPSERAGSGPLTAEAFPAATTSRGSARPRKCPAAGFVISEMPSTSSAEVPGGDGLERGGHADHVGARGAQHPDLGRSLVVRPGNAA